MFSSIETPKPSSGTHVAASILADSKLPFVEVHRHTVESPWTYSHLDSRQREVAESVRQGHNGVLLVSEVAPVITTGRRTPASDIFWSTEQLGLAGIELHSTDRGGLATYHGPGQWVLFPVDRLEVLTGDRRGVRIAVEALLEAACEVGKLYDPRAEIRSGCQLGVWTKRGKFASVGIHIEGGVLLHGLSVNGFRTQESFSGLRPCGQDASLDYLLDYQKSLDQAQAFVLLQKQLVSAVTKRFWQA